MGHIHNAETHAGKEPSSARSIAVSLLLVVLLLLLSGFAPAPVLLDRQLRSIVEDPHAPLASLAVVIVADDAVVYESYWGSRRMDIGGSQRNLPVTSATKFRVASIAKMVTALGALQLVDQGKLDLDADIGQVLGFPVRNPSYPTRPITARMLLNHTSSLRDGGFYNLPAPYTLRDLLLPDGALFDGGIHFAGSQQGADRGPGAFFTYANLNYGVLGTVMEAAAGERFDQYMARHLLQPLGIDGGYRLGDLSGGGFGQLATIYSKQDVQGVWEPGGPWYAQMDDYGGVRPRPVPPATAPVLNPAAVHLSGSSPSAAETTQTAADAAPYMPGTNATLFGPHASLRISARDLGKLLIMIINQGRYEGRQIVSLDALRQMLHEEWRFDRQRWNGDTGNGRYRAWGLGVQHGTNTLDELGGDRLAAEGNRVFWGHHGDAYGFLGGAWFDPLHKVGFVYLIGGVGADPYQHRGEYSSATRWEELIQTAILDEIERMEESH
jgi:CubicO group peptidase (beta-lactamase class C family)